MNISLKKVIIDSSDEKVIIVPVDLPKGSSIEQEESWESFCIRYAAGDWNSRHQSTPPPSLKEFYIKTDELIPISDEVNTLKDLSGYQDFIPAPQNPQAVYDLFKKTHHLTAPLGPFEDERQRVCRKYGLYDIARQSAIDMVCALAKEHYGCSIATVSVVLDDREVCSSMVGFPPMEDDPTMIFAIPLREAICSHLMTKTSEDDAIWVMDDVREDWRFAGNPHVKSGGMCFLASCNIFLPTSIPAGTTAETSPTPSKLPCGSICILDTDIGRKFSIEDEVFLKQLANIVGRELQLEYEQRRQETVTSQTAFLGEFLRASLVLPNKPQPNSEFKSTSPEVLSLPFQDAAKNLQTLTSSDAVVIFDLRAFNAAHAPMAASGSSDEKNPSGFAFPFATSAGSSRSAGGTSYFEGLTSDAPRRGGLFSGLAPGAGNVSILGAVGYDWESTVGKAETRTAISQSLMNFYANGICSFDLSSSPSPLADILPPATTASLTCPIFDYDGKPALLLVAISLTSYFRFEAADRQFLENVGAVAIGSLLRRRILEADRAKLAFVSQVSHELRTPLHAIGSQLELIRIVTAAPYLNTIKPLLAVAEVCVASLREILDDTLTFAKMSNPIDAPLPVRKLQEVILENLVEDVVKSCWARTRQHAAVSGDTNGDVVIGANGAGANVKIVMEIDDRYSGCKALVDVGGLKRVLFNLVGNALKFTVGGTIKIAIKVLRPPTKSRSNYHCVGIDVVDTGVGMSEEFLKEQLFIPFRQLDSFSSGAGLGISICDNIVKRMNGTLQFVSTLGVGTTASVAVPLELFFDKSATANITNLSVPKLRTRIISDELNELLDPCHFEDLSESASPGEESDISKPVTAPVIKKSVAMAKTLPCIPLIPSRLRSSSFVNNDEEVLVLVVDDNIIARKILTTFLSVKGVKFIEAENGLDAVEAFKSYGPSLVWCDIQMPVMDGLEATRQMRVYEQEHNLSPAVIVALSGLSEEGSHSTAVSSGQISQWLTKGGRSLKILGEGLATLQAEGVEQAARNQRAASFEAVADVLRKGLIPSDTMLKALSFAIPLSHSFQLPLTPPVD